ncbi:3649_t:CDS:2 [Paraglomus brasilianum]|uniref:3649_t:CDS:1 n=1 Tax=Paraglomus brasilianum TaxID=144538 RepID=A0A9N9FC77_9GLOM|nr:3649_t:CDS:2 [Paraglomus brasilianum]
MRPGSLAFFLVVLAVSAVANIVFITPNSRYYAVANKTASITWTYSGNVPTNISLWLGLKQRNGNTSFETTQPSAFSVPIASEKYDWKIPSNWDVISGNWVVKAYPAVILNGDIPYHGYEALAESETFSIKPVGTEPPQDSESSLSSPPLFTIMSSIAVVLFFGF